MVHSRNKGHNRERAIRHRFIAAGWPDARRGDQSRAGHEESDVCVGARTVPIWRVDGDWARVSATIRVPGFRIEVKNQLSLPGKRVLAAYAQAVKAARQDEIPLAVFHVHRGPDLVLLDFGHLLQLASCGTANDTGGSTGDLEPANVCGELEDVI